MADRHEIDQGDAAVRGIKDRPQNQGVVVVGATDARRWVGRRDSPSSMLGRAEKSCEQGIAVEAWPAQPVYGAVAADESRRRAIANQSIILDIQREIGSYGCLTTQ